MQPPGAVGQVDQVASVPAPAVLHGEEAGLVADLRGPVGGGDQPGAAREDTIQNQSAAASCQ